MPTSCRCGVAGSDHAGDANLFRNAHNIIAYLPFFCSAGNRGFPPESFHRDEAALLLRWSVAMTFVPRSVTTFSAPKERVHAVEEKRSAVSIVSTTVWSVGAIQHRGWCWPAPLFSC